MRNEPAPEGTTWLWENTASSYNVATRYVCSLYWALSVMTTLKGDECRDFTHSTHCSAQTTPHDNFKASSSIVSECAQASTRTRAVGASGPTHSLCTRSRSVCTQSLSSSLEQLFTQSSMATSCRCERMNVGTGIQSMPTPAERSHDNALCGMPEVSI
eukprot:3017451-Prymnesium_polylepis.2